MCRFCSDVVYLASVSVYSRGQGAWLVLYTNCHGSQMYTQTHLLKATCAGLYRAENSCCGLEQCFGVEWKALVHFHIISCTDLGGRVARFL